MKMGIKQYKINKEIKEIHEDIVDMMQQYDYNEDNVEVFKIKGELEIEGTKLGKYLGFQFNLPFNTIYKYQIEPRFNNCIAFVEYLYNEGECLSRTELSFFDFLYNIFSILELS